MDAGLCQGGWLGTLSTCPASHPGTWILTLTCLHSLAFLYRVQFSHLHKGGHECAEHLPDSKSKQCAVTGLQRRKKKSLVSSNSVRVKGGYSN